MEAVNNYVKGLQRTGSWNTGPSGFSQNTGGNGSVDFSVLLQTGNTSSGKNTSSDKGSVKVQNNKTEGSNKNFNGKESGKTEAVTKDKGTVAQKDTSIEDNQEEVNTKGSELAVLMALMSDLQADRVTTAGGEVELVTERISTEASPPSVTVQNSSSGETGNAPIVDEANLVPALGSESKEKVSDSSEKTVSMEEVKYSSGYSVQDTGSGNSGTSKYDPEEILKSLEGQGHIISTGSNSPSGTPSMDTNGPTGRAPEDVLNREEMVNGPTHPEIEKKEDPVENTKDPMEGYEVINPAAPSPFANQTSTTQKTESTNETMMMRTTETNIADDLTNLLASRFPSQNGSLTIELDPENLGKITINVSYESGHAAVSISATNQKTVEILTQNAPAMANIIQQKTGQQTEIFVPSTQESQTKQDMASSREQNENAAQQQARQQAREGQHSENSSISFLQQMRLGLV